MEKIGNELHPFSFFLSRNPTINHDVRCRVYSSSSDYGLKSSGRNTFEEHPGERAQEEEVQQTGDDAADDSLIRLPDPANE